MPDPTIGTDFKSDAGHSWIWCAIRQCWQLKDYKYMVYPSKSNPVDYSCAIDDQWRGVFKTFQDAENACEQD